MATLAAVVRQHSDQRDWRSLHSKLYESSTMLTQMATAVNGNSTDLINEISNLCQQPINSYGVILLLAIQSNTLFDACFLAFQACVKTAIMTAPITTIQYASKEGFKIYYRPSISNVLYEQFTQFCETRQISLASWVLSVFWSQH